MYVPEAVTLVFVRDRVGLVSEGDWDWVGVATLDSHVVACLPFSGAVRIPCNELELDALEIDFKNLYCLNHLEGIKWATQQVGEMKHSIPWAKGIGLYKLSKAPRMSTAEFAETAVLKGGLMRFSCSYNLLTTRMCWCAM